MHAEWEENTVSNLLVGICGGSGSGKTTLAQNLVSKLGDKAVLLSMDAFYKYQSAPTYEERAKTNYDHPDAFDSDLLADCLAMLKDGKDVQIPVYDYTIHNRSDKPWEKVESKPVIVIDGILLFAFPKLVELMDLKVFVDTPADVRILRRLLRDVNERERSPESVVEQYLNTVKPMHDMFIEPTKTYADIIVPEGGFNTVACDVLCGAVEQLLLKKAE